MYPLLPWKVLSFALAMLVAAAVYADDLGRLVGWQVPDTVVVRFLPVIAIAAFSGLFASTGYWAPWRILWRCFPMLNSWFPDLNGVWVGSTISNWPTIKKMIDSAASESAITEQDLSDTPEQRDAIAVRVTNSLFSLRICAALSSTEGESHSIVAKPWRRQHTDKIHLSYVYEQETPRPAVTDEAAHLGAADLVLSNDQYSRIDGTYWTKRSWRTGRNTAGKIELMRVLKRHDKYKALQEYAADHKAKMERDDLARR